MSHVAVPVNLIAEISNPVETPPWPGVEPEITPDDVMRAFTDKTFLDHHKTPLPETMHDDGTEHIRRIAWLMHNPIMDPIHIDTTAMAHGCWPVIDGNHRLYAALMMKHAVITVFFSGFESDIERIFGRDTAAAVFRDQNEPERA